MRAKDAEENGLNNSRARAGGAGLVTGGDCTCNTREDRDGRKSEEELEFH